jgi:hypothetical protein
MCLFAYQIIVVVHPSYASGTRRHAGASAASSARQTGMKETVRSRQKTPGYIAQGYTAQGANAHKRTLQQMTYYKESDVPASGHRHKKSVLRGAVLDTWKLVEFQDPYVSGWRRPYLWYAPEINKR